MQDKKKFLFISIFILCVFISLSAVAAQDSSDMDVNIQESSSDVSELAIDDGQSATLRYSHQYNSSEDTLKSDSSDSENSNLKASSSDSDVLGDGEIEVYVPTSEPEDFDIEVSITPPVTDIIVEVHTGPPAKTFTVSGTTFQDIQNTINMAGSYDYVDIPEGTYLGDGTPITITKHITLRGQGSVTLNGQGLSQILIITDGYGDVTVQNINFVNGYSQGDEGYGGAVVWGGARGKIKNCNFENNSADFVGGAIVFKHYDCRVENCNFINNFAVRGGAIASYNDRLTITGCNFIGNKVPASFGGAVLACGDNYVISNSYFANNSAQYGGAIAGDGLNTKISSSTFVNNDADISGGAILIIEDYSTVEGCHYTKNTAGHDGGAVYLVGNGATISNCDFNENNADDYGGAVLLSGDNGKLLNSEFTKNSVDNENGGAVYISGNNFTAISSNFENNHAPVAAAFRLIGIGGSILDSTFVSNDARYGGCIVISSENFTVKNSNFTNNSAEKEGGSIYIRGNNSRILDSRFENNHAGTRGGAILAYNVNVLIKNCNFEDHIITSAEGGGGAILWICDKGSMFPYTVEITDSYFTNNYAALGVVTLANINDTAHCSVNNCRFKNDYTTDITSEDTDHSLKFNIKAIYEYYHKFVRGIPYNCFSIYAHYLDGWFGPTFYIPDRNVTITSRPYLQLEIYNSNNNALIYNETIQFESSGSVTYRYGGLPDGDYRYRAYSLATDEIPSASCEGTFGQHREQTYLSLTVSDADYPESPVATVTASSPGTYTLTIGGTSYSVTFSESEISNGGGQATKTVDFGTLDAGSSYSATVNYEINDYYGPATSQTSFNVYQGHANLDINGTTVYYSQDIVLDYTITEGVDFNVIIKKGSKTLVNGTDYTLIIKNGKLTIRGLAEGTYTLSMTTAGNTNYVTASKDVTLTVKPLVDLGIGISVNNQTPFYGDTVVYTITVSNNGPSTATDVVVSDTIPNAMNVSSPDASYVGNGVWNIPSIGVGSENAITLTLYATVNSQGSLTNTVSVTSKDDESNTADNSGDISINPIPIADISVSGNMAFDGDTLKVGDNLICTFTVTNEGPCDTSNVRVTDVFDSGLLSIIGATLDGTAIDYNGEYVIDSIAAGSSRIIVLTFNVINNGTVENALSTESDVLDVNVSNNAKQCDSVYAIPLIDLSIVQTLNNNTPFYGDTVIYTIALSNNGPSIATDVTVTFAIPNGMTASSHDASYIANGVWKISSLKPGSENAINLTLYATVNTLETLNTNVAVTSYERDSNIDNNNASADIKANPIVDLKISSISNVASIEKAGDLIVYTITVANNGPCNASGVKVTEILSPLVKFVSADVGSFNSSSNIWDIGSLNTGDSVTLVLTVEVVSKGTIENNVSVVADEYDSNINNNYVINTVAPKISTSIASKYMVTTAIDKAVDGNKGQYFKVTLKDGNNNPLVGYALKITLNKVTYTIKTKSNGVASLQVNIKKAGKYTAKISFAGDNKYLGSFASATVKVNKQKPKLTSSKKTFKAKAKVKKVTAKLKTSRGKVLKSKKVTFTIKGKKYTVRTNKKGVATAKIKLTKKGKYTCKIKFAGDSTYSAITKKIKVVLK